MNAGKTTYARDDKILRRIGTTRKQLLTIKKKLVSSEMSRSYKKSRE